MIKRKLARIPGIYKLRIVQLRVKRMSRNLFVRFAKERSSSPFSYTVKRHHHSFDPFPDDHRVLPFGSGASVFFNYVDLRFYNPTPYAFHFHIWLTEQHLKGHVTCEQELPHSYHLEERNHRFHRGETKNFRENEIWRKVIDKRTGNVAEEYLMIHNYAEVKYELSG